MRHIGEKMILLLCIAVFGIAAVKLIDIGKEYYDGQKEYKELKAYIKEVPACQPEKMKGDESEKETGKEIDFEGLRKINEDLVAWIQIPGIGLDYPVVQGEDNEYYLYHTFQKENNKAGSIFLDYRNHDDFTDRRVILYGHNMKDGSMFSNLKQYQDSVFRKNSDSAYLYLPEKTYSNTILIVGIIGGAAFIGSSQISEPLSAEVLAHTPVIQRYASEFGIPEYVSVIQAIMMQESGGRGTDPMQASECPYNTQYPNTPGAIQDADYSIKVGVQYYADCVWEAGCKSPQDMDKLKLSLQGYNYGNGYITWAIRKHGGYSEANALQFSQEQAAAHGWPRYGDPEYVPHVLRYYSGGGLFAGLFGNGQLVTIAKSQLGNEGGQKFWSWYGFDSREEWCACFVSWCADQAGLIQKEVVPKFSVCTDGVALFQAKRKWQGGGSVPTPGSLIFFDWNQDGASDHVGIVESCDGTTVHTIEGNSGDAVKQNSYTVNSQSILGYGLVTY